MHKLHQNNVDISLKYVFLFVHGSETFEMLCESPKSNKNSSYDTFDEYEARIEANLWLCTTLMFTVK